MIIFSGIFDPEDEPSQTVAISLGVVFGLLFLIVVVYFARKYYVDQKKKQKVYAMTIDPDAERLDSKIVPYSPSTGNMEAGGKFDFLGAVIYDDEDSGKVVFEPKVKPVDMDKLFGKTPVIRPAAEVHIAKKPARTPAGPRGAAKIVVTNNKASALGIAFTPLTANPSADPSHILPFSASNPFTSGEEEKEEMEPKPLDISEIALFKAKLDTLMATKKPNFGLYSTIMAKRLNNALLYIKPHACHVGVQFLISSILDDHNVRVVARGKYSSPEIEDLKLFDKQFGYLAQFAENMAPEAIALEPTELLAFKEAFGEDWSEVVTSHRVFNSSTACESLCFTHDKLYALWKGAAQHLTARRGLKLCRVDSTNTCDDFELVSKFTEPIYLINGFFPSLRATYIHQDATVHYMAVEWEGNQLAWPNLLQKVIGDSHPELADSKSIRGKLHQEWEELGLQKAPDRRDNGVHFSKSAFEGLADRLVWSKGAMMFTDPFGSRLLGSNIPSLTVQNWLRNPVVQGKCIFDHMYALEAEECLMKAQSLIGKLKKRSLLIFYSLFLSFPLLSSVASATHRRGNLASLLKAKASLNTNKIAPAPTPVGAVAAGADASAPSSRATSPGKSTKRKSSSRKSKNKIAPEPLQIATGLEEPSWIEDGDSSLAINLESPSQFSAVGNLESPSRLSAHTFEPHASLASTVAQGALDYGSNPFASPNSKLNEPSIETLNLADQVRPVSPEKPSKSAKHSKKDKKSPDKGKSSKEKSPKKLGAQVSTVSAFSDLDEDASPPPSRGANAITPGKSKQTEEKNADKEVDEMDPTGSMRFAAPSKFARQNPSLLLQQPSRVLQKVMEEQEVASAERKLKIFYCCVFYCFVFTG